MKKLTLFFIFGFIWLITQSSTSAIIQVSAPADLNLNSSTGTVSKAADGDTIELTTSGGAYSWTTRITTYTKSITIRAAAGLAVKPVIIMPSGIFIGTTNNTTPISLVFDGIEFIGNTLTTYFVSAKSTATGDVSVKINNCYFHSFPSTASMLYYSNVGTDWSTNLRYYSELKVNNSEFDGMSTLFVCSGLYGSPTKLTISNCYFANMGGSVLGTALYEVPGGLVMDHCTFDNCASTSGKYELNIGYKSGVTTPAIISNTLFANRAATSTTANSFGTAVSGFTNTHNAVYYTTGTIGTIYPTALNYSITSDPVIVNKVATGADYLNAATDGLVIGYKGIQKTPPTLVGDVTNNDVDHLIDLTFSSNSDWESSITAVKINNSTFVPSADYEILPGIIRLKPSGGNTLLQTTGTKAIKVIANNYADLDISQVINVGSPAKLFINVQPVDPETNGGTFVKQPVVLIQDQYGNATSSTATVTANIGYGAWTLGGTLSVPAVAGTATFTDLTATCSAAVTGATINFSSGSLLGASSGLFNIPFSSTPTITVSTEAINGFQYIYGNGPSSSKYFTINGLYISGGITITPSTNIEISTDNVNFVKAPLLVSGAGTIGNTTIYARFAAGLIAGSYNSETLILSSTGAGNKTISLSGSVLSSVITTSATNLTSLDYVVDLGPSPEGSFTVFSNNLVGDITVTAPTNFELSLTSGGIFSNVITIPKDSSEIDVYVRLTAGLNIAKYNGNIIITSPNVTIQSVPVIGSVTKAIAYNELHNLPDPQADPAKVPRIKRVEYTAWPVNHGDAHVTLWDDDKVAALSLTMDDNHEEEHYIWLDLEQKYGFVGTWFVMTDRTGKPVNWSSFQNMWDHGNDVQSHSVHHLDLKLPTSQYPGIFDDEYGPSVTSINTNLVGGNCQVIGYPYAFGDYTVSKKYFIGGRGGVGQVNWADNINYINTYATTACDTTYVGALLNPNVKIFNKSRYGDWSVITFHNIHAVGNDLLPKVDSLMSYIAQRKDRIWVTWFRNVIKFGQERDSHTLTVTSVTDSKITFNLTDLMVDSLYDYPLTVKIRLKNDWDTVYAFQNGKQLYTRMLTYNGNKYVLVKAVPDRGEIQVVKDISQGIASNFSDSKIQLQILRNKLMIKGIEDQKTINIYSVLGEKIVSKISNSTTTAIELKQGHVYFVQIGVKTYKVVL